MARKLTQRKFYRQLVVALCHSIPVRPAATQHHADNTLERLCGNHYSERGKEIARVQLSLPRRGKALHKQCLARAQAALLFASIHASWLTIRKHFSNYCPLKHAVSILCVTRPILVTYAFIVLLLPYIHCPSAYLYITQTLSFIIIEPCVFCI